MGEWAHAGPYKNIEGLNGPMPEWVQLGGLVAVGNTVSDDYSPRASPSQKSYSHFSYYIVPIL